MRNISWKDHLLSKRKILDTGCWEWTGHTRNGYGKVLYKYREVSVNRLAAHLWLGLDLNNSNELACHKKECDNKRCFNPDHLYVGDNWSNMRDKIKEL